MNTWWQQCNLWAFPSWSPAGSAYRGRGSSWMASDIQQPDSESPASPPHSLHWISNIVPSGWWKKIRRGDVAVLYSRRQKDCSQYSWTRRLSLYVSPDAGDKSDDAASQCQGRGNVRGVLTVGALIFFLLKYHVVWNVPWCKKHKCGEKNFWLRFHDCCKCQRW